MVATPAPCWREVWTVVCSYKWRDIFGEKKFFFSVEVPIDKDPNGASIKVIGKIISSLGGGGGVYKGFFGAGIYGFKFQTV